MMTSPSGMWVTSPSTTVMLGWIRTASVTAWEKASRSTARAPPASTRVWSAQRRMREPQRRSSSFSSPTAFSSWSERRELEHTSSAKPLLWWAGVILWGFISCRVTPIPRWASCQAASQPAKPAPMMVTFIVLPLSQASSASLAALAVVFLVFVFFVVVFLAVLFLAVDFFAVVFFLVSPSACS